MLRKCQKAASALAQIVLTNCKVLVRVVVFHYLDLHSRKRAGNMMTRTQSRLLMLKLVAQVYKKRSSKDRGDQDRQDASHPQVCDGAWP